jgi:hypothetical protein
MTPVRRPWFWLSVAAGVALMAFGVHGLLTDTVAVPTRAFLRWFAGALVVHDALVAPIALGSAWLLTRALPVRLARACKVGLGASAVIAAYSWPFVRGYGRAPTNPSALPLDYGRNLAIVLAIVWLVVAAWVAVGFVRPRTGRPR